MGGVIITLTRGMGEPTYRLSLTRCRSVRLGGLFGGRRFCTEDFCWTLGSVLWRLFRGEYYTSLCVRRGRGALNGSVLLLVTAYLPL